METKPVGDRRATDYRLLRLSPVDKRRDQACSAGRDFCQDEVEYESSWRPGRLPKRVSHLMCNRHGEAFAHRHGIEVPP